MNKFLFFIFFLAISLGYVFEVDKMVARNFNPFESIKKSYIDTALSVQQSSEKYFNQLTTIEELQKKNTELRNYELLYKVSRNELNSVLETVGVPNSTTDQVRFTNVLSYVDFDDYTKVWIDLEESDNQILGLISNDKAAGIVINKDGRSKALLNGNEKCNYAIFVGNNKAPGIIHPSKNAHALIAKFIPIWFDIKEGDEVITSGMDGIFFEGLKVGKVVSIKKMQDTQEATIVPYAEVLKEKSFFVYKKIHATKKEVTPLEEPTTK